jgi:hypothetical protein
MLFPLTVKRGPNAGVMREKEKDAEVLFVCLFLCFEIGSCFVAQAHLGLMILLPQPPKCWGNRHAPMSGQRLFR